MSKDAILESVSSTYTEVLGVINLELTLFPWLHLYEGLSFGVGVAVVVEVVVVVVVEGVAPETVAAGVEAVGTVVVGVEAAGTVVVEELVLETVALVEGVAPETTRIIYKCLRLVPSGNFFCDFK